MPCPAIAQFTGVDHSSIPEDVKTHMRNLHAAVCAPEGAVDLCSKASTHTHCHAPACHHSTQLLQSQDPACTEVQRKAAEEALARAQASLMSPSFGGGAVPNSSLNLVKRVSLRDETPLDAPAMEAQPVVRPIAHMGKGGMPDMGRGHAMHTAAWAPRTGATSATRAFSTQPRSSTTSSSSAHAMGSYSKYFDKPPSDVAQHAADAAKHSAKRAADKGDYVGAVAQGAKAASQAVQDDMHGHPVQDFKREAAHFKDDVASAARQELKDAKEWAKEAAQVDEPHSEYYSRIDSSEASAREDLKAAMEEAREALKHAFSSAKESGSAMADVASGAAHAAGAAGRAVSSEAGQLRHKMDHAAQDAKEALESALDSESMKQAGYEAKQAAEPVADAAKQGAKRAASKVEPAAGNGLPGSAPQQGGILASIGNMASRAAASISEYLGSFKEERRAGHADVNAQGTPSKEGIKQQYEREASSAGSGRKPAGMRRAVYPPKAREGKAASGQQQAGAADQSQASKDMNPQAKIPLGKQPLSKKTDGPVWEEPRA